ncbi:MAG: hypothetical protein M0P31_10970 [Solirubrobacteraceae bacterium]|nr:hypothetical protein [Solirubrobacteraceae bacterium]
MKTVLKVTLGVLLAVVILIGGCAALLDSAADEVQKDSDRTAITPQQYRDVQIGERHDAVVDRLGEPASADEFSSEIEGLDEPVGSRCVLYGRKGELLAGYHLCFDINTDRLESKSAF